MTEADSPRTRTEPTINRRRRARGAAITAVVIALLALVGTFLPLDDSLKVFRNSTRMHAASGAIAIIAVDEKSVEQVGRWPWSRRHLANLVDRLNAAGTSRIFFDFDINGPTTPAEDGALRAAFQRSSTRVTVAARFEEALDGTRRGRLPSDLFRDVVNIANINFFYDYRGAVWNLRYENEVSGVRMPTFAAAMAGAKRPAAQEFPIDFAIDPKTIPIISAADVLSGRVSSSRLRGRTVVFATDAWSLGDQVFAPGYGQMSGVFFHVLGAETLRNGPPVQLGWLPAFLVACCVVAAMAFGRSTRLTAMLTVATPLSLIGVSFLFDRAGYLLEVAPACALVLLPGARFTWTNFRVGDRGTALFNAVSGLPNLEALKREPEAARGLIVMTRVLNFADITSAFTPDEERKLVEQIARRLTVADERRPFQGDEGLFAMLIDPAEDGRDLSDHLTALKALFRHPVLVDEIKVDLAISFGVDRDVGRPVANRLSSALVAADEAAQEGIDWKYHDATWLQDSSWHLSLLSQLDDAIDAGDVWVAYQPKYDVFTRELVGAEALARWTHPTKGPIGPDIFVGAAEQHGRIEKLTLFVLDRAIATAAAARRAHPDFVMAVNLSAKLLESPSLVPDVGEALARHGVDPTGLILELTETAAFASSERAMDTLDRLRATGIGIAIDDYGTGLSTLDYLRRVPATEIKIDRSFIQSLDTSSPDRLLVNSTIQLAHSLGLKVVAEGIEQRAALDMLQGFGCDLAQGYLLARPMPEDALLDLVAPERAVA